MRKFLLAAAAVIAMTGAAHGEDPKLYAKTAGDWEIYTVRDQCTAADLFKNGTVLSFGVNTSGYSWVRVIKPEWKIPSGIYEVDVKIDDYPTVTWKFEADKGGQGIVANFEMDRSAFAAFTKGNALRLKIGDDIYGYSLKGTSALFPKLLECVGQVAKADQSNPFGAPAAPVSAPANPFKQV